MKIKALYPLKDRENKSSYESKPEKKIKNLVTLKNHEERDIGGGILLKHLSFSIFFSLGLVRRVVNSLGIKYILFFFSFLPNREREIRERPRESERT
jgi:hypothetical protein